ARPPQLFAVGRFAFPALRAAVVPAALLFGLQLPVVRASLLRHRVAGGAVGQPPLGTSPPELHGAGVDGQVGGQVAIPQANVRTAATAAAASAIVNPQ